MADVLRAKKKKGATWKKKRTQPRAGDINKHNMRSWCKGNCNRHMVTEQKRKNVLMCGRKPHTEQKSGQPSG